MKISYTHRAEKDKDALNEPLKSRICKAIEALPAGNVKRLKGFENLYRLTIGGHRVIFAKVSNVEIDIVRIAPRGQAYKGL